MLLILIWLNRFIEMLYQKLKVLKKKLKKWKIIPKKFRI